MKKIAVVIEDGKVVGVYASPDFNQTEVEVIDFDTTIPEEQDFASERLNTVRQYLCKLY